MNVHKSHTKGDLRFLFESLKVYVESDLTKREIIANMSYYLPMVTYNNLIPNLTKFKEILRNVSDKRRFSTKLKRRIMHIAKKIIVYCKTNYSLNDFYSSHSEVYLDCLAIYLYGDLPMIRRALRLYNQSPYKQDHINPIISIEVQELLKERELLKKNKIVKFKKNRGKYLIHFP